MKKVLLLIVMALMSLSVFAQQSNIQKVTIKTNGTCEHCKKVMMDNVPQWKGVKECTYDMKTSEVTISYDANKTTPADLRNGISKLGYDADNVKADAAARAKIPACCTQPKTEGAHSGCGGCGGHHDNGNSKSETHSGCSGHHDNGNSKSETHSGCGGHHDNGNHNGCNNQQKNAKETPHNCGGCDKKNNTGNNTKSTSSCCGGHH